MEDSLTTPRVAGLRGKLPAKRLPLKFVHEYAPAHLPAPSYPVNVTGGIGATDWGMLGNGPDRTCTTHPDGVGNCTFAGRQHLRMAKAAGYKQAETWETSNELVAEYLKYDHGQDEGAVIADLLLSWYKAGKILAFAPVDHTNPAAVDSAMQAFHGIYAGVDLTDDADDLFERQEPWTTAHGERADPSEGHCIVKVYADDPASTPSAEDGWVSWGALQRSTKGWTKACTTEMYVIITSEDEAAKVDMPALTADIEALDGTGAPSPASQPDHVGLLAELAGLVRQAEATAEKDFTDLTAFLSRHGL